MKILGLDVGTNSVGSAWVDTETQTIKMGVSVFPAGVEEGDQKRGAPKNQARRSYRSQRRSVARRARRKRQMRAWLVKNGWMPTDPDARKQWLELNPWLLRAKGLERELTLLEFGRVLLHMAQRRGAYGFDVEEEEEDTGKIKKHLVASEKEAPTLLPAYQELGRQTIPIALAKGRITEQQAQELEAILAQPSSTKLLIGRVR